MVFFFVILFCPYISVKILSFIVAEKPYNEGIHCYKKASSHHRVIPSHLPQQRVSVLLRTGPCPTQCEIWFLNSEFDCPLFSFRCLCQSSWDLYWDRAALCLKFPGPWTAKSFNFCAFPVTDVQKQNSRCLAIQDLRCSPHLTCSPPRKQDCLLPFPLNSSSPQCNTVQVQLFTAVSFILKHALQKNKVLLVF